MTDVQVWLAPEFQTKADYEAWAEAREAEFLAQQYDAIARIFYRGDVQTVDMKHDSTSA